MDSSKKSNKIRDIVRLQQLLKKWKHLSKTSSTTATRSRSGSCTPTATASNASGGSKGMKFLRKTLSFSDSMVSSSSSSGSLSHEVVPKGYLAVCVGKELKRYVIPTEHLSHQAFGMLLREAEEEFGFQQAGVLRIPCEVGVFEMILKVVQEKRDDFFLHELDLLNGTPASTVSTTSLGRCSPDSDLNFQSPAHPQLCRPDEAVQVLLEARDRINTGATSDGKSDASEDQFQKMDTVQVDLLLGKTYSDWGHINDAVSVYDELISSHPNDFRGYLAKARFFTPDKAKSLVDRYSRQ